VTARSSSIAPGLLALAAALVLAGCTGTPGDLPAGTTAGETTSADASIDPTADAPAGGDLDSLLAAYDLDGLDARQVIERLDATALADRPTDLMASVRPDGLVLVGSSADATGTPGTVEVTLPMPEDEFYLSIAPYLTQTHDCHHHSLTTCVGELRNEAVDVTIVDADTGTVLVEGPAVTHDNGFVGFWVPRGVRVEVTVEQDGRSGTEVLTTDAVDDRTCVTTLRLV